MIISNPSPPTVTVVGNIGALDQEARTGRNRLTVIDAGTIDELLQETLGGKNLLSVLGYGTLGQLDQELRQGRNRLTTINTGTLDELLQEVIGGKNLLSVLNYGSLGQVLQETIAAKNLLSVLGYGSLGQLVQASKGGVNALAVYQSLTQYGEEQSAAGQAFVGWINQASVAGQQGHIQIFNPVGSTVFVYVDSYVGGVNSPASVDLAFYNTALATDGGAVVNKNSGGAAGQSHIRSTTNAGLLGTKISELDLSSNSNNIFTFFPPYRLSAGQGLLLHNPNNASAIGGSFNVRELTT